MYTTRAGAIPRVNGGEDRRYAARNSGAMGYNYSCIEQSSRLNCSLKLGLRLARRARATVFIMRNEYTKYLEEEVAVRRSATAAMLADEYGIFNFRCRRSCARVRTGRYSEINFSFLSKLASNEAKRAKRCNLR